MAMDEQTDPGYRYSLAIASAHSYQRGIELNPFNYRVRFYFAGLLQEEPRVMEDEFIYQTPLALLQENVRLAPVFIENQMELADYLKKTGNEEEAYRVLIEDALPWVDLRHEGYKDYRIALYKKIFREAVERADRESLERLLRVIKIVK
ncbi:MAG TPA: hypothetical protein DCM54_12065 [Gammaproteobacteria bacterium]|nr:hypothetical protein [Gammaproteobacteria bacterium]|tara:strand:- start:2204 stop:2650 length:447 start_codon:yes stop_codon:yes gene_type:complete